MADQTDQNAGLPPPTRELSSGSAGLGKDQIKARVQIMALMKKNLKIHMRTNACPCCTCCGPGQCCPFLPFSACVMHFLFPIFFVFVVTAVPYLVATMALDEQDRKDFLEVKDEKPIMPKPYAGFSNVETSRAGFEIYGLFPDMNDYTAIPDQWELQNMNNAGKEGEDINPNWGRRPPAGVMPLLTTLFEDPELKMGRYEVPNLFSCHCKTLGIVGPGANDLATYLGTQYADWQSNLNAMHGGMRMSKLNFRDARNILQGAAGSVRDGRRLSEVSRNTSKAFQQVKIQKNIKRDKTFEADTVNRAWQEVKPLVRPRFEKIRKRVGEIVDMFWTDKSARRLQKGKGGGGDEEREVKEEAIEWGKCRVDAGHEKPIFRVFGSEDDIQNWIEDSSYGDYSPQRTATSNLDRLCGAIILENNPLTSGQPEFTIKLNVTGFDNMDMDGVAESLTNDRVIPEHEDKVMGPFYWYYTGGFLAIQDLMHKYIGNTHSSAGGPTDLLNKEAHFVPFNVLDTTSWIFGDICVTVLSLPLTQTLQFGPIVASLAYYVSRERGTRQRELMRMMGLTDAALMWSWVLLFVILNFFLSFFMMLLFQIFMIKHSDWFIWWMSLWLFANGITTFGMSMAAFVSTDKWAALAGLGIFFAGTWTVLAAGTYPSKLTAVALSLIPSNGFIFTAGTYFQLEWWKVGATWGNLATDVRKFNVFLGWVMMFIDFWLWLGIWYYFDQVVPWHTVGVSRRPWFCCTGAYWREFMGKPPLIVGDSVATDSKGNPHTKPEFIEQEDDAHLQTFLKNNQCVVIDGLEKSFRNAQGELIKAVDGLSFKMYQDECFCLLGHNGAGKTTTMMMMTGCLSQSGGTIKVRGCKIPEQIRAIRKDMGFCPQHNVLFDELTVAEHLELFGKLGGMSPQTIEARGNELLTAVALLDKKLSRASALSGGMKRKLSAALAFLAEPYMVVLDEPSSGMDPFARRGMWDTLKRWRTGHIICLTTHYMDEADALGDRIAIMSNGRLACSGSSTFLKKTFGCGYVLSIAKSQDASGDVDGPIIGLVSSMIAGTQVMSSVGKELLIQMPFEAADQFPELFPAIDRQMAALKIVSYGTSVTNLEEVFLKVAKMEKGEGTKEADKGAALLGQKDGGIVRAGFCAQFIALFLRRVKFGIRDRISFCCNLFIPVGCLLIAVALMSLAMVFTLPKLVLDVEDAWNPDLETPNTPISVGWSSGHPMASEIETLWAARRDYAPQYTTASVGGLGPKVYASPLCDESSQTCSCIGNMECAGRHPGGSYSYVGTPLEGVMQEAGFVDFYLSNKAKQAASQFGAVFYPMQMSWCPKRPTQYPGDDEELWDPTTWVNVSSTAWWPQPGVTVFANLTATHSQAIMFKAHGEAAVSRATNNAVTKIKVANHPFDKTEYEKSRMIRVSGILAAVMIMAAYGFIPSGATYYVVLEKEKDVYNQLIISGASQVAYWLSNFVFDVMWGMLPAAGAMIIFAAYGMDAFLKSPGAEAAVTIFIVYMPAMAGFAYLFSFMFSKAGNALIFSWIFNLSVGFLGVTILSILTAIEQTYDAGVVIRWIFRMIPTFSLGYGFLLTSVNQAPAKLKGVGPLAGLGVGGAWCKPKDEVQGRYIEDRQCRYMIGDEFLCLMISSFLYIGLTIAFDVIYSLPAFKRCVSGNIASRIPQAAASQEDDIVLQEKQRVANMSEEESNRQFVFVKDLHKIYGNRMHAVRGISFACAEGQVFGLLGVNGAGKTSTFKILCGQVDSSAGQVKINGIDVSTRAPEARRLIGYCPQFDALLDSLTVDEHLYLYGRLKGLAGPALNAAVSSQIQDLDLAQYVKSRAGQLSGGNKRKLSVAMATIAEPPMVFLDEPSAGMDPVARRGMWSLIQNIADKRQKSVVILTTHSMEEAEALCSRIAIQVDGQFRCLGNSQEIKSRYGQGLELNVRLATPTVEELRVACTKMGGESGKVVPLEEAAGLMTSVFGAEVTKIIEGRPGSPLIALPGKTRQRGVQLGVLCEWGLLQERISKFENFMVGTLGVEANGQPCCNVLEKTQNVVRYQVLPVCLQGKYKSLGNLFQLFKDNKATLMLEDFQICQTSLEQVFNRFAATQVAREAYGGAAYTATAATTQTATQAATTIVVNSKTSQEQNGDLEAGTNVNPVGIGRAQDTEH